tara:strand:- start:271 stop:459 length:189 start_codon:yes stop_codon:yes gene_type:complete
MLYKRRAGQDVHYVKSADRYARVAEQKVSRETGAKKLALFLKISMQVLGSRREPSYIYAINK